MSRTLHFAAKVFVAALILTMTTRAQAATYTVNSSSSYLEITDVTGADVDEQFTGSATIAFTGTADVTISGSTITFNSAAIEGIDQSGIAPQDGGASGTADANAGIDATLGSGILSVSGPVALRNVVADAYSSGLTVTSNTFDASGITLELTEGHGDYRLEGLLFDLIGGDDIDGASGENEATLGLILDGGDTIAIPVELNLEFEIEGIPITVTLEGGLLLEL